jgi:fructose-specific phosphotransferase system IIC component
MTRTIALEVILLAAWLGAAILVAAAVAPAAFRVLPARTLAGALVGEVLPVIFFAGLVIAAIAVGLEARGGARWARPAVILPYLALMIGCIVAQFIIGPKIEAVRSGISGALDALDPTDPRRVQFGRLHAFSVLWMGVAMIGAASALARFLYDNKY